MIRTSLILQLKWLERYATIQDDGTVQFEVPGDIKPQSLDFGTGVRYNGYTDKEDAEIEDAPALPPLQIVMLIVGTRGDVQPFVAIGKRLQVKLKFFFFFFGLKKISLSIRVNIHIFPALVMRCIHLLRTFFWEYA